MISAASIKGRLKTRLRSCFNQAVKWELMEKNPALKAEPPKEETAKREIWTAETLFKALKLCDDPRLALALNLSFCCSLRAGELLGLTWDCVMLDPQSIDGNRAYILVNKELQRVDRQVLELLEEKDVYKVFPSMFPGTTTILVLKKPKTDSSMRKVFMPKAVAEMLVKWREIQKSKDCPRRRLQGLQSGVRVGWRLPDGGEEA